MLRLLAGIICLLVAGCAPSIQVRSSFDPQADFSEAASYSWLNDVDQPGENVRVNNELTRKTVRQAVEQALEEKGFTRVERQQADLLVAWFGAIKTKVKSEGIEHFYSPYGYGPLFKDPYWNTSADSVQCLRVRGRNLDHRYPRSGEAAPALARYRSRRGGRKPAGGKGSQKPYKRGQTDPGEISAPLICAIAQQSLLSSVID